MNFTTPIPDNEVVFMFDPRTQDWHPTVQFYLSPDHIAGICEASLDKKGHSQHYLAPMFLTLEYVALMGWALAN